MRVLEWPTLAGTVLVAALAAGRADGQAPTPRQSPPAAGPTQAAASPARDDGPRWGLSLKAAHRGLVDEIASPLRATGTGVGLGFRYRSLNVRSTWGVGLSYAGPSLDSDIGGEARSFEDLHAAALEVHYLRRVRGGATARLSMYAGIGSKLRVVVRQHHYDVRGTETYADGFAPVELQGMWRYRIGSGDLSGRLAVAAFSIVARDPYTGAKYAPDVEVAGPFRVPELRHVLSYRFRLGPSFDAVLAHELGYLRYPGPRELTMVTQDLGITLEWRP